LGTLVRNAFKRAAYHAQNVHDASSHTCKSYSKTGRLDHCSGLLTFVSGAATMRASIGRRSSDKNKCKFRTIYFVRRTVLLRPERSPGRKTDQQVLIGLGFSIFGIQLWLGLYRSLVSTVVRKKRCNSVPLVWQISLNISTSAIRIQLSTSSLSANFAPNAQLVRR
jgi:hypothetical protein